MIGFATAERGSKDKGNASSRRKSTGGKSAKSTRTKRAAPPSAEQARPAPLANSAKSGRRTKRAVPPSAEHAKPAPRANPRPQRQRFRPLEYWRGERVVYGQPGSDAAPFESIVDVMIFVDTPSQ